MNLFNENTNGAEFSKDRKYRYALWRIWDDKLPLVCFICLNPSNANENEDDPTIRRVKRFAHDWGYGGVYMLNLFAFVTPYPKELLECQDPVGDNDKYLQQYATKCEKIIFAWGNFDGAKERGYAVEKMFKNTYALVLNKDYSPRHPLYVSKKTKPIPYSYIKQMANENN